MNMSFNVIVHTDESGGYWAEVENMPGCITEGDTIPELTNNLQEAIFGWLSVMVDKMKTNLEKNMQETDFETNQRETYVYSCPTEWLEASAH